VNIDIDKINKLIPGKIHYKVAKEEKPLIPNFYKFILLLLCLIFGMISLHV